MRGIKPAAGLAQTLLLAALLITTYLATTPLDVPVLSDINDKLQHLFAFFCLAWLADHGFPKRPWGWRKALPLLGYGLVLEVIQYTIPGRYFSLLDLTADTLGLLLYGMLLPLLHDDNPQQEP